jgi:predicted transcriptional regulator
MSDFAVLTGKIVSAYVLHNPVRSVDLPDLIRKVHSSLDGLIGKVGQAAPEDAHEKPTAAQIRKSVTPAGIISFLDGKTYKILKRHLRSHGLNPQSYCERFGLPADYPMVSGSYAAYRSELAKSIGLGQISVETRMRNPR